MRGLMTKEILRTITCSSSRWMIIEAQKIHIIRSSLLMRRAQRPEAKSTSRSANRGSLCSRLKAKEVVIGTWLIHTVIIKGSLRGQAAKHKITKTLRISERCRMLMIDSDSKISCAVTALPFQKQTDLLQRTTSRKTQSKSFKPQRNTVVVREVGQDCVTRRRKAAGQREEAVNHLSKSTGSSSRNRREKIEHQDKPQAPVVANQNRELAPCHPSGRGRVQMTLSPSSTRSCQTSTTPGCRMPSNPSDTWTTTSQSPLWRMYLIKLTRQIPRTQQRK